MQSQNEQVFATDVWEIFESGYQYPASIPTNNTRKKQWESNAKVVNDILGSLDESEFVKVMQLSTTKEIWDKIVQSYEGDTKVKNVKLKSYVIQCESLRMHNNERIENFFLRVDEFVNTMKGLGVKIGYVVIVENILRSLTPKFDTKVSNIEEMQDLKSLSRTTSWDLNNLRDEKREYIKN